MEQNIDKTQIPAKYKLHIPGCSADNCGNEEVLQAMLDAVSRAAIGVELRRDMLHSKRDDDYNKGSLAVLEELFKVMERVMVPSEVIELAIPEEWKAKPLTLAEPKQTKDPGEEVHLTDRDKRAERLSCSARDGLTHQFLTHGPRPLRCTHCDATSKMILFGGN